jgi:LacI family transcriptional regulator
LKDVARVAGVHPSTASRALNDQTSALVQQETIERVRRAAHDLGYRVNGMARALKTRRSMAIGMVVPDITNPFFPPAVRGAEETLAKAGFSLLLSSSNNDADRAQGQLDAMIDAQVDGLLLAMIKRRDPIMDRLRVTRVPAVLFNRTVDEEDISSVVPDDATGSRLAVAHLNDLGHKDIGLVVGPLYTSNGDRRLRAFTQATRRHGLRAKIVEAAAFDEISGYRAGQQMFREHPNVTAVVAGNDLLALGVIDAATERGLRCPRDVSVVGFNDMPLAGRLQPPLTTISIPEHDLGRLAAECLISLIEDPAQPPKHILVPVTLVVRGSTGPPRRAG